MVHSDQAPSLKSVERWSKWFRGGREELEDEPTPGRPITKTSSENIEQVRLLISDDRHITIEEVHEQIGLT